MCTNQYKLMMALLLMLESNDTLNAMLIDQPVVFTFTSNRNV